jgi:DsbC/DsbD-like thiol-disulfide interchange protein
MKLIGLICVLALSSTALAKAPENLVKADFLADTTAVLAGRPFTIGLHLQIADGWHVYWTNPGDAGAPTTLKITVPAGYTVGPVQYPVPEKLPLPGGLVVYAYEKELLLTAVITPPGDLKGSAATISAAAGWCVCNPDECVLGKRKLELELPSGEGQPANTDLFAAWRSRMPVSFDEIFSRLQVGFPIDGIVRRNEPTLTFTWRNDPPASSFQWLPGPSADLNVQSALQNTIGHTTSVGLKITPVQGIVPTSSTISGILAYYQAGQPPRGVAVILDRETMQLAPAEAFKQAAAQ